MPLNNGTHFSHPCYNLQPSALTDMARESYSSSEESLELYESASLIPAKSHHSKSSARLKREQFAASLQSSEEDVLHSSPQKQGPSGIPNGLCTSEIDEQSKQLIKPVSELSHDGTNGESSQLQANIQLGDAAVASLEYCEDSVHISHKLHKRDLLANEQAELNKKNNPLLGGGDMNLMEHPYQNGDEHEGAFIGQLVDVTPGSQTFGVVDQFVDINGVPLDERHIESTLI